MLARGHPISFQRCQHFPALPAFSSVASIFQRCQHFPALPAFSSVASFFQRCHLFPALPPFSSVATFFHHFQTLPRGTGFQTRPAKRVASGLPIIATGCQTLPNGATRCHTVPRPSASSPWT